MEENPLVSIPKVIHYCWFGKNPLPKSAIKCIASWKKYFPDYDIQEWNEDSFDVNIIPYTRDAYQAKKYAFVSDFARFWILYQFGGVYFDTDVEVIGSMDDILMSGPYIGIENPGIDNGPRIAINPGLGFAVQPGNVFIEKVIEQYRSLSFWKVDGKQNPYSMIPMVTDMFLERGLLKTNSKQLIEGITIYPRDFFNPLDDATGRLFITENTRSIHWYTKSWISSEQRILFYVKRIFRRVLGMKFVSSMKSKLIKRG